MPRLTDIDELLSPAQKRRKEAVARQAAIDASFRPAPYALSKPSADEILFGTADPERQAAMRAEGGIFGDPDIIKKQMTEDPAALGATLEQQLADIEAPARAARRDTFYQRTTPTGTLEFTNIGDRLDEPGWRQYMKGGRIRPGEDLGAPGGGFGVIGVGGGEQARMRRERATALQQELAVTPPSTGEQHRQVAKHMPTYLARAEEIGALETIEQGDADAANRKIDPKAWAVIRGRLGSRAQILPDEAATLFEAEQAIPGTRTEAEQRKAARLKMEADAKIVQAQQEQAERAAAKPDQLTDLMARVQTPSGPEAAPESTDPMKSIFGAQGPKGLPVPGLGRVFSYNPEEWGGGPRPNLPSLDPLREVVEGLTFAAGGRESPAERRRRLAREKRRRG